ncbi:hypothetical protein [Prevotella sp.]|uniref:hypothetical protein n=1 Tax=Prevotella sp. TaxID=59823 RepID=UPI002F956848
MDYLWLDVGLYGGVLLFGRGVLGQPPQYLCRCGLSSVSRGYGLNSSGDLGYYGIGLKDGEAGCWGDEINCRGDGMGAMN